jgi:hypothetical protein
MYAIRLGLRSQGRILVFDHCQVMLLNNSTDLNIKSSAKDAVAALIKRLAHRNANVQLYTLEVRIPVLAPTARY